MKKRFFETELQILVSPSFLITSDNVIRPSKDKHLKQGHLLLSALQVRYFEIFPHLPQTIIVLYTNLGSWSCYVQ